MAVRLETTGRLERKPLEVVKKFNMVVTPSITRAGTAFHSIQKVTKDEVTRMMLHLFMRIMARFCLFWMQARWRGVMPSPS